MRVTLNIKVSCPISNGELIECRRLRTPLRSKGFAGANPQVLFVTERIVRQVKLRSFQTLNLEIVGECRLSNSKSPQAHKKHDEGDPRRDR